MKFYILGLHKHKKKKMRKVQKYLNFTFWLSSLLWVLNSWSIWFNILTNIINPNAWGSYVKFSWILKNMQKNEKQPIPLSNFLHFFGLPIRDPNYSLYLKSLNYIKTCIILSCSLFRSPFYLLVWKLCFQGNIVMYFQNVNSISYSMHRRQMTLREFLFVKEDHVCRFTHFLLLFHRFEATVWNHWYSTLIL